MVVLGVWIWLGFRKAHDVRNPRTESVIESVRNPRAKVDIAGMYVFTVHDGKHYVLSHLRGNGINSPGQLSGPGGAIDPTDSTDIDGGLRELMEETLQGSREAKEQFKRVEWKEKRGTSFKGTKYVNFWHVFDWNDPVLQYIKGPDKNHENEVQNTDDLTQFLNENKIQHVIIDGSRHAWLDVGALLDMKPPPGKVNKTFLNNIRKLWVY